MHIPVDVSEWPKYALFRHFQVTKNVIFCIWLLDYCPYDDPTCIKGEEIHIPAPQENETDDTFLALSTGEQVFPNTCKKGRNNHETDEHPTKIDVFLIIFDLIFSVLYTYIVIPVVIE
jgi:hypothetical protein